MYNKFGDIMNIVLCLDNENGMMFNNRRQSRDSAVTADILNDLNGEALFVSSFSEKLFDEYTGSITVFPDDEFKALLQNGAKGTYFVENTDVSAFFDKTDKLTVYCWNRLYPADVYCTVDFNCFKQKKESEFAGTSHEKITKAVYEK